MKNFVVYDQFGKILRVGVCGDDDFSLQGDRVLEGIADPATQYVEDGQLKYLPPQPAPNLFYNYQTRAWEDPRTDEQVWADVRYARDAKLLQTDWTQLPDVPLTTRNAWAEYRQALRDITNQPGYPLEIIWPTPPGQS